MTLPVRLLPSDPGLTVEEWLALPVEWLPPADLTYTRQGMHQAVVDELTAWPNLRPVWVHVHAGIQHVRDGRHRAEAALVQGARVAARVWRS